MSKQIVTSDELKKLAKETITELAGIVKATLGPGGNPIIIKRDGQNPDGTPKSPLITKDGVTVAEAVNFTDPVKNTIAQAIIQVAKDTVNEAGDGTTTAIVLAEAIYNAGYRYIEQGQNNITLYEDLKKIKDVVLELIDGYKTDVTIDSVFQIAEVSANGDKEIAQIIQEAIDVVGESGHISLEEGTSRETSLSVVEGAMYKQGYRTFGPLGSNLVTDRGRDICELHDPAILLYAGKLEDKFEFSDFLNKAWDVNPDTGAANNLFPLLIVANDFSDDVKTIIIKNKVQGGLPIAAIKTPFDGSPNARTQILEDLAALTGGSVSAKGILPLEDVTLDHFGSAETVEISAYETVFFGGKGDEQEIIQRTEDLNRLLDNTAHDFDKENLRVRIGKLSGGIAVIKVGGDSELEILEKKDRIEDALCAAKVALQDGIVAGGGTTLMELANNLKPCCDADRILKEAMMAPFNQIITNIGGNPEAVKQAMGYGEFSGYNARTRQFVKDMVEEGIIDPAKVTKSALENAVSIAGLLLTTGGAITDANRSSGGAAFADGAPNPFAGLLGA